VTNVQFEAYAPEHRRSEASAADGDPATGVTFEDARAYCEWYGNLSRKPMRLPTESEWLYAQEGAASFGLHGLGPDGIAEWVDDETGVIRRAVGPTREVVGLAAARKDLGFRLVRSLKIP
jgi:formylglycine-generating enzyme required for sulfatase activity